MTNERAKYRVLADKLIDQIRGGRYAPGERFPSVRELAAEHGIATASAALRYLTQQGWVYGVVGAGTFVTDPLPDGRDASTEGRLAELEAWRAEVERRLEALERER